MKESKKKTDHLNIRIAPYAKKQLLDLCEKQNRSQSRIVTKLIDNAHKKMMGDK